MLIVHNGKSLHLEPLDPRLQHYRMRHFPGVYWGADIDPATGQPWAKYDATGVLTLHPGAIGEITNVHNLPEKNSRSFGSEIGRLLNLKELQWETWDADVFQKRKCPPLRLIFKR